MDLTLVVAEAVLQKTESCIQACQLRSEEPHFAQQHLVDVLASLYGEMEYLEAKLLDLSDSHSNRQKDLWSMNVRRFLYEVDDIVDDILTSNLTKQLKNTGCNKNFCPVFRLFRVFTPTQADFYIMRDIQTILLTRQTLQGEIEKFDRYGLDLDRGGQKYAGSEINRETISYVDDRTIVGRYEDRVAIIDMVLDFAGRKRAAVIPIVGMEGMGKTALAQLLFNDERIQAAASVRLWVHVGLRFNFVVVIKKILEQMRGDYNGTDLERLQYDFRERITGERYFLVLDDISTIDREMWSRLMNLLSVGESGSSIILTTCSRDLASNLGTVKPYELGPLSPDDAWSLFTSMAFDQSQTQDVDEELLSLGKEICKKAGNVPLTIKTLGSKLRGLDKSKWEEMQTMQVSPYHTSKLSHSFLQLQSSTKRCFAYCAIFPRGYQIRKQQLLQLWIAQGFVQPPLHDSNQSFEDAAENCFTELQNWSLFKDVNTDEQGNICSFKMNDLEFDLAQYVAAKEISLIHTMKSCTRSDRIYHVSVDGSFDLTLSAISRLPNKLRSFVNVSQSNLHSIEGRWYRLFSHLRLLRVLDLHALEILEVPDSIGSLKKLRYLNLSSNPFDSLPHSLLKLVNLQVLDLSGCKNLRILPKRLAKLVNLRHLYLCDCEQLTSLPVGVGQMTSLRTLSRFVLGKDENSCKLDELNSLNLNENVSIVFAGQQTTTELEQPTADITTNSAT